VELGAYAEALRVSEHRVARMRILEVPYRLCWALDSLALVAWRSCKETPRGRQAKRCAV
jgi:hypothetical protein